ncbi:MAG: Na+/H+ antiporter NhaC family protein, partial [Coriobacteriales bacterium]
DYFNCLTVGSVMRPVTDGHRISRAKLSYLIDATAAPICMIAPISSWAAAVSGVVEDYSGFDLFVRAIPFNFYSLLTIVMVLFLCKSGMDYGPMRRHELNAIRNGDLFTEGEQPEAVQEVSNPRARVIDLVLPIVVLVVLCVAGLIYSGVLAGGVGIFGAFENCDAFFGLPWGALIALVFTVIYFIARRVITFKEAMACVPQGFCAMVPAILILTFAVTLKSMTGALGAATFVAGLMEGAAAGLFAMLPAIIFLVAWGLAFATGTSWGTFGILIPIVLPIFANEPTLLTIGISACLAGAVAGDHCSPISDTTVMASAGANMNHIEHVNTQLPYVLTMAGVSFVCFVIAGFVKSAVICLPIGAALVIGVLLVIKKVCGKSVKDIEPAAAAE